MIQAPLIAKTPNYQFYRDSADRSLVYVDALQVAPRSRADRLRLLTLPSGQGYMTAEVSFGAGEEGLQEARIDRSQRSTTMPWGISPVFAWLPEADGVRIVATGRTSGYGSHNAVLAGSIVGANLPAQLTVAAELCCEGRLVGARVKGSGDASSVRERLKEAFAGAPAHWYMTTAEALIAQLRGMLDRRELVLLADVVNLPLPAVEDLQNLVLMEWAHRIAESATPAIGSLALPAAQLKNIALGDALNLQIDWREGDLIPIRAIRALHPEKEIVANSNPEREIARTAGPEPITVTAEGDWSGFDYVEVSLCHGPASTTVTLTKDQPVRTWNVFQVDEGCVKAEAVGAVRGVGLRIPLPDPSVAAREVKVRLSSLEERALLVRADRGLLKEVGPFEVNLHHPALAAVLVPEEGSLMLRPEDGNLARVSAVYRALFWKDRPANDPFTVAVRFPSGIVQSWQETSRKDEIVIEATRLPLLRIAVVSPLPASVKVAVSQKTVSSSEKDRLLGLKAIAPDQQMTWVYDPNAGPLFFCSKYLVSGRKPYRTAWHPVKPNGTVLAPKVRLRKVVVLLAEGKRRGVEIELAPAAGTGGSVRATLTAGQASAVELLEDVEEGRHTRYRTRDRLEPGLPAAAAWSKWTVVEGAVINLEP